MYIHILSNTCVLQLDMYVCMYVLLLFLERGDLYLLQIPMLICVDYYLTREFNFLGLVCQKDFDLKMNHHVRLVRHGLWIISSKKCLNTFYVQLDNTTNGCMHSVLCRNFNFEEVSF